MYDDFGSEATKDYSDDIEIIISALKANSRLFKYVSFKLRDNKDLVLEVVNNNAKELEFASPRLKNDKEIVLAAVKQSGFA